MDKVLEHKFDSIIFDLDGTLWDSTKGVAKAWQTAKEQVDYVDADITAEQVAGIAGMAYDAIYDKLFPTLTSEKRHEFKTLCAVKELQVLTEEGGELYPHLDQTLAELSARYKLFIVSNCQTGYIEIFLEFSKLGHYFAGHQCYGTKNRPKADNIRDIMNDFSLQAPVYVGDTTGDYKASAEANVPFIFAAYGFGEVKEGYIASVASFAELAGIL